MPNYSSMLAMLKADMAGFVRERDSLQQKIERISAAIDAVEILAIQDSDAPILAPTPMTADEERGFTDRVRDVLQANPGRPLTAVEVRDVLLKSDKDADPRIALIHTHNTLKRLDRQLEVKEVERADGKTAYRWLSRGRIDYSTAAAHLGRTVPPVPGLEIGLPETIENETDREFKRGKK